MGSGKLVQTSDSPGGIIPLNILSFYLMLKLVCVVESSW